MRALGGALALALALVAVTVWLPAAAPGVYPSDASAPTVAPSGEAPADDALVPRQEVATRHPAEAVESLQFLAWIPLVALGVRRVRTVEARSLADLVRAVR